MAESPKSLLPTASELRRGLILSALCAVFTAPITIVFREVLSILGVLDPVARAVAESIVSISPGLAGWLFALLVALLAQAALLWWFTRRPVHIHHKDRQADTEPLASVEMDVHLAPPGAGIASKAAPASSRPTLWDRIEERNRGSFLKYLFLAKQRDAVDQAMDRARQGMGLGTMGHPPPLETWMPLDEAIRYLAKGSQWGAGQDPNDPYFSVNLSVQLRDALACGDLTARGRKFHVLRGGVQDPSPHPLTPIPPGFWQTAHIDAYRALRREGQNIGSRLVENAVRSGDHEGMYDVQLNKRQMEVLWPSFTPAGQPPPARSDMAFGDYWKEAAGEWVELLWLRDEFGQGRPKGYWQTTEGQIAGFNLLNRLRQAAVDEEVVFRGRRFDYDRPELTSETVPLTKIPPGHFEENSFMLGRFLDGDSNYQTFTGKVLEHLEVGLYRDIRANREQLQAWCSRYRKEHGNG
jgi:hypothetical protein